MSKRTVEIERILCDIAQSVANGNERIEVTFERGQEGYVDVIVWDVAQDESGVIRRGVRHGYEISEEMFNTDAVILSYLKQAEREEWAILQEMKARRKWSKAHTESIKDQQAKWFCIHGRMVKLEIEMGSKGEARW